MVGGESGWGGFEVRLEMWEMSGRRVREVAAGRPAVSVRSSTPHLRSSSTSPTDGETTPIEPTMLEGRTKISSHAEAM